MIYPGANPPAETPIDNGTFWPAINPAEIRADLRMDGTVTPERLRSAILGKARSMNRELRRWRLIQQVNGYDSLAEVAGEDDEVEMLDGQPAKCLLYRRALAAFVGAELNERFASYDATHSGQRRADEQMPTRDDYLRDARWAMREIQGLNHCDAELI